MADLAARSACPRLFQRSEGRRQRMHFHQALQGGQLRSIDTGCPENRGPTEWLEQSVLTVSARAVSRPQKYRQRRLSTVCEDASGQLIMAPCTLFQSKEVVL